METYRVAIIGCGKPRGTEGATGFGMAHRHMQGYQQAGCKLIAVADVCQENGDAFVAQYGGGAVYSDYREMLKREKPDIVSVCTWPKLHAEMTIAAAEAGVKAVHCEKPMAPTFGEARRMFHACESRGVQLSFNHQRRFLDPFIKARELLRKQTIGKLLRIEASCGNFHDWGTHWIDMMHFFNNETPAEWVMAQIDTRNAKQVFGLWHESQGISHIRFQNGVHGLLIAGSEKEWEADIRLIGELGVIELAPKAGGNLRYMSPAHAGWQDVPCTENLHGEAAHARGVVDVVDALRNRREPELSGQRAMRTTEVIYASYESARRGARIDLPLVIEDHPLLSMIPAEKLA